MSGGRYLYGDSEPFPSGYDFLAALRQFVAAASKSLVLAHEADELERSLGDRAQEHLYAIETIQTFFSSLGDVIAERAARSGSPQLVGPYASQLVDHVEAISAQARALRSKELDGASVEVTSRIRERRAEIRQVVGDYLLSGPLPVLSWAISLNLAGTAPNGQAVLEHPGDVTTAVAIDVVRDTTWSRARRIGDIVTGMTMQVGFKKAFLRSSLHPDIVALDELVIAALELGPDSLEIRLRRKLDAPRDAYVITVEPDEHGKPQVKVTRMDERGSGGADPPYLSEGDEARRVLDLVAILRTDCAGLLANKKRLLSAQLDGHDVFERGLVPVLLQRIADRLAPIASEVSRHSPNPSELSLKFEREGGRREEVYLKKAELGALVAALPPELLQVFAGLAFLPPSAFHQPPSVDIDVAVADPVDELLASVPPATRPARPSAAPPPPKRKW